MKIKGVIFDFNGTLFWDTAYQESSWDEYLISKGIELSDEEKRQYIHGRNSRDTFEYIFKRSFTDEEIEELSEEKEIIYRSTCLENKMEFAPGAVSLIEYLSEQGIEIAIATASGRRNVDFFIEHFDLLKYFKKDYIIFNDGKVKGKPFPDLFNKTIDALGIERKSISIFEDSASGIQAAINAGVGNITIVNSANSDFSSFAFQEIRHFDEVDRDLF